MCDMQIAGADGENAWAGEGREEHGHGENEAARRRGLQAQMQKWVHTALLFGGGGPAKLQELHQTSLINERDGHVLHERLLGAGHLYTSSAGTDEHVWINTPSSASGSSRTNSGQRSSIQARSCLEEGQQGDSLRRDYCDKGPQPPTPPYLFHATGRLRTSLMPPPIHMYVPRTALNST